MAQRPSHRLNLYLVPTDPDRVYDPDAVEAGLTALREAGLLDGQRAGAQSMIDGGFALLRLDTPAQPTLYGNRQGGYRVRCPACACTIVTPALAALAEWRQGGDRSAVCTSCGVATPLESLDYAPQAAPARFALEVRDVGTPTLNDAAVGPLELALGGSFVVVGSRG